MASVWLVKVYKMPLLPTILLLFFLGVFCATWLSKGPAGIRTQDLLFTRQAL